jgi:hypothetical protein
MKKQKPFSKQTARFLSVLAESLPLLLGEEMQYWIQNPSRLQKRLKVLKLKKIVVIGNSSEFLGSFFETARIFLGIKENDFMADHKNSDRVVFVDFRNCNLEGSSVAGEEMGFNTVFYKETYKLEQVFSSTNENSFGVLVLDPEFLEAFKEQDKKQYEYFIERIEPLTAPYFGKSVQNHFIFKSSKIMDIKLHFYHNSNSYVWITVKVDTKIEDLLPIIHASALAGYGVIGEEIVLPWKKSGSLSKNGFYSVSSDNAKKTIEVMEELRIQRLENKKD